MIIELLGFVAPPDKHTNLYQTLYSSLGPTRVKQGCLECRLYHDADADKHYLESRWSTEDDLIRHVRSDAYKKLLLLMELGATVCLPKSPMCLVCPLSECCRARQQGTERTRKK